MTNKSIAKVVNWKEIHTKSNYLSLFRLFLFIPIMFLILNQNENNYFNLYAFGICILAYITDILDGFLARKYNEITEMGKIIDPLADKVFIIFAVFSLYYIGSIPTFYFLVIILRDLFILTGGIIVSKKLGKVLPSDYVGKGTVLFIGFFLLAVLLRLDQTSTIYSLLYYISLILSFISVINYCIRAIKKLKMEKE